MRKIFMILVALLPLAAMAQNSNWERPQDAVSPTQNTAAVADKEAERLAKQKAEAKYLRGAAPIVDGYVQWNLDVDVPGKTADEIYATVYTYMDKLTKGENQLLGSQIALVNREERAIATTVKEWIIFKNTFFSLDRVKTTYVLTANASDGKLHVNLSRIVMNYTENVPGPDGVYVAEDWISDEKALNSKGKMYPGCAKFRRKMIDRKDQIFDEIRGLWK